MVKPLGVPLESLHSGFRTFEVSPTVMFEDPDGRARETRAQHQGGVIQLITQNETTLREFKKTQHSFTFSWVSFLTNKSQALLYPLHSGLCTTLKNFPSQ